MGSSLETYLGTLKVLMKKGTKYKRIHHKMAIRDVDMFDKSKGTHKVQLCIAYSSYVAKNPILEMRWENVTCRACRDGKWNDVPDGFGLKLVE